MNHIEITPKPKHPALEEIVISHLQDNLANKCCWLNHVFNKAQRLCTKENARGFYPAILLPCGKKNEYISLFPDESLRNFAFFYTDDSQKVEQTVRSTKIISPFSCIVWGDTRTIHASRTEIKESILKAFELPIPVGRVSVKDIYEKGENIYRGFDIKEIDSQYLMEPYFGLRIEGTLTYYLSCHD